MRKARKVAAVRRPKFADERYLGPEPTVTPETTDVEFSRVYSWYNYFYKSEDAKSFTIAYLKSIKYDKKIIQQLNQSDLPNWVGWHCRLLSKGSALSGDIWERTENRIREATRNVSREEEEDSEETGRVDTNRVISIKERVQRKSSELIGELEEQLDVFFKEGTIQFDVKKWSLEKAIKPQIAKKISEHFTPIYAEILSAMIGEDADLVESYKGWRKPVLKVMSLFLKRIVEHMNSLQKTTETTRKPRAKKIKPASVLVAKMKFKPEDTELGVKSVDPKDIVGCTQLWTLNTKYKTLSVYNAEANSSLSVKGTSIIGFDPATSVTKKLRKPKETIALVLKEGKVGLRKIMSGLTTKEARATGRMNVETVILKVVK